MEVATEIMRTTAILALGHAAILAGAGRPRRGEPAGKAVNRQDEMVGYPTSRMPVVRSPSL